MVSEAQNGSAGQSNQRLAATDASAEVVSTIPVVADELRAIVKRIIDLKGKQDGLSGDIREVYSEANSIGLDKQAIGQLITYLRKREKDATKLEEQSALFEQYRAAYEQASLAHARGRAKSELALRRSAVTVEPPDLAGPPPDEIPPGLA